MKNRELPVTVDKIIPGGFGLGRLPDGKVVLVRHVLPGEEILVRPQKARSSYMTASLARLLRHSTDRVEPPCSHYGRCGGCDFQHIAPGAQLRIKKEILAASLRQAMGRDADNLLNRIRDPIASPAAFGYRQRIRLHTDKSGRAGFHRFQSHDLEPVTNCPLASPSINNALTGLLSSGSFRELLAESSSLELFDNTEDTSVVILLHFSHRLRPRDMKLAGQVLAETERNLVGVLLFSVQGFGLLDHNGKRTEGSAATMLRQTLPPQATGSAELVLTWEAGGFCQINQQQNNRLIRTVLDFAGPDPQSRILDLYCGMGNFSIPLAMLTGQLLGLDGQGAAIRNARLNAANAGLSNCDFEKTPVVDGVRKLAAAGKTFDIITLDPPRQGAADLIPLLAVLNPAKIVYISCDPATLCRDLGELFNLGFEPILLQPLDMFPQTHHLETVALLEAKQKH